MPAALPLVAGAFLAAGSIATAVGLTTAFVVAGLAISWAAVLTITGVALLAVAYLARKTPKPDSGGQQLKQKLDPQAPVPVLYGRSATGGFITWRATWGSKNAFYGIVTVLSAGGPIAGIESYKAGDYPIGFGGSPAYSLATVNNVGGYSGSSKLYKGKLAQRWQNGAAPANTTPGGASGLPIPVGAMSGLAHVVTRYEFSNDAFPQGLPSSLWTASGVKLYDPRQDSTYPGGSGAHRVDQPATWTYSENPFLAALQWALGRYENGKRVYGIGAKWAEVDVASFVTGANVADANGWKVGGVVTTDDDKYAVLASLLAAGGGVPVARGAQIACTVNAPKTSVLTLTKEDIVGEVETSSTTSWRDRQNTIIPKYREETQGWEIIAGEQISSPVYIEEDGGEQKTVEVEFPLVQQAAQAHQLATYELCNSREFLTFTVNAKLRLLAVRVGDAITVNVPQIAAKNIKCTITGREFNPSDMSVTLSLKSETDAKHAFALGQSQVAPPAPKLDGYDPSNPGAPAANAWAITATQISKDETTLPVIVVTGATDDPNTSTVIVEYRPTGSDTWLNYGEFPRTTTKVEISGLTDQTAYDVALSYRTVLGVVGERLVLNATAGAFTVSWSDTVTGANKPADNATVGAPVGTEVGGRPVTQLIGDVDNAKGNAQTAVDALKNSAGVIVPVSDILASERATTNAAVADAKKAGTDAQAALAQARTDLGADITAAKAEGTAARQESAQVRTDLTASVNTVRGEAAQAQTDANTARTDLAAEVSRAKGEEGAIRTTVANVKQTADNAAASISDEITVRANADSALANRARDLEATVFNGPNQNSTLSSRITDEETVRATADEALSNRSTKIEASVAGVSKIVPNDYFDNGLEGWTLLDGATVVQSSYGRSSVIRTQPGAKYNEVRGRKIAINSDKQRWKLKVSWRCAAESAIYYFGAVFYDADGGHIAASDGTGNYPLGPNIYCNNAQYADWINREVIIGKNIDGGSIYGGTTAIPVGAVYFRPIMFINYTEVPGSVTELDYFAVEDVTEAVATNALITDEATTRATADTGLSNRLSTTEAKLNGEQDSWVAARIRDEATAAVNRETAIANRATALETSVNNGATGNLALQGKISDEATTRSNADGALSTRLSTTEAKLNGDQDSWVAARIRDEATASANRDSAITNRTVTLESSTARLTDIAAKNFPGFETTSYSWGYDTEARGRNSGSAWEPYHAKGAGIAFPPGFGSWLYMDPTGWIKTTPGKRYRAGFWVWQWSAPNGYGGNARVYWEGNDQGHTVNSYLGATSGIPEETVGWYQPLPNGAWHCYGSDILVDDAMVSGANSFWIRPRINIDKAPANAGYVIAGWFFREVTGEYSNAAKITEEATTRSNADGALANRAATLEAQMTGGQDSWLAARVRDEATASTNRDTALGNRVSVTEARSTGAGNLVGNTDFVLKAGWNLDDNGLGMTDCVTQENNYWNPRGETVLYMSRGGTPPAGTYAQVTSEPFSVTPNSFVQFYAMTASHRCRAWTSLFYYDENGAWAGYAGENYAARYDNGGSDLNAWDQTGLKSVKVPANARSARFAWRVYENGTGQNPVAWFFHPYVGAAREGQTEWNAFSQGSSKRALINANARITDEATARADADGALATRANNLEATVFNGPNQNSSLSSRITDEATARVNAVEALANRSNTIESKLEGNQPSGLQTLIKNNRKNLIDTGWWKQGAAIPWGLNGGQRNEIVNFPHGGNFNNIPLADGSSGDAWLCQADGSGGSAGGWGGAPIAPLDPDKTYRFVVPIAQLGGDVGRTSYWGTNNVCDLNTTSENGNPYFAIHGNMTLNRWHLFVGYLFPRNSTGKTHDGAGVFDMVTGNLVAQGWNYCFKPDGAQPVHRAYQYYSVNGAYQAFGRPMVELVDGSESPILTTLATARGVTAANARINSEETTRANQDSALAGRIDTTEAKLNGAQDSWLAARIRDEATASVNRDTSITNRTITLESAAAAGSNSLNGNCNFTMWPDGQELPNGMTWWSKGNSTAQRVSTTLGRGGYGLLLTNIAGQDCGIGWDNIYNTPGWYVMEADVWLQAGYWEGAGLTLGGAYNVDFFRDPDTAGNTGEVSYGGVRRFTKLINFTDQAYRTFHPMNQWGGLSENRRARSLLWLRAVLRPATAGEILAQKANSTADNAQARITDEATTRANQDTALGNRITSTEAKLNGGEDSWLAARVRDEATASANRDTSLGNRLSTTEAQIAGGQDSWLAARIRDEATASANRDNAISSRTSVVEAQVSNDSTNLVRNAIFNQPGWGSGSSGIPPSWGGWAQDGGGYIGSIPRTSKYGASSPLQIDRQGDNSGVTQYFPGPIAAGWYVIEADVDFEDGNHTGAGVHVQFNNGYAKNLSFGTDADTNNAVGTFGNVNRKFSTLYYNGANSNGVNLYLMAGWTGFTGTSYGYGFLRTIWHKVSFRPATSGEIQAQKVTDSNLIARVGINETAVVDAKNKLASARLELSTVAGNNRAQITLRSDNNGGAGVDIVGDVNFAGNLNVGPDGGGNRVKITNSGMTVFDANGTMRVRLGLW